MEVRFRAGWESCRVTRLGFSTDRAFLPPHHSSTDLWVAPCRVVPRWTVCPRTMRDGAFFQRPLNRSWIRRGFLWSGSLAALVALFFLFWGTRHREPQYLGKTQAQWFPYLWDLSKGPLPGSRLTDGAPESFPLLWSALRA